MIYDLFTFAGEYDMLEIHLNVQSPYVDKFVITEGIETFSGNPKPLYWVERDTKRFQEWEDKIVYFPVIESNDKEVGNQIIARGAYVDQPAFMRAFYQKEMLRKTLETLNPDGEDVVCYGDVDELWKPKEVDDKPHKLRQLAYSYYINNRSPEDWRGTVVTKWKNIKDGCLNDLRANPVEADIWEDGGWHFTNLGGAEAIKKKLESYDHQEVNIPWIKDGIEDRLSMNVDFLGRDYHFWVDESELPQYLLDNKDKYKHLWKS